MKALLLTKYDTLGASSRLRTLQYVPAMRAAGWDVRVEPLLPDEYVRALYERRPTRPIAARALLRRLRTVLAGGRTDLVWIEKETWPWLPDLFERLLTPRGTRVVVDYDDAIFHLYDLHRNGAVRALLGRKIDAVMRRADLVLAGNDYLAARARAAGARAIEIVPTVIDLARYEAPPAGARGDVPVIGWVGSPDTVRFLAPTFDVFNRLVRLRHVRCVAVGARPDQLVGSPFEAVPWTEATEVAELAAFDIGVMPLQDTPWQRGKCGYKLIQYMGCRLPVVASPVGVNTTIIEEGSTGLLATTHDEWLAALVRLLDDPALRRRFGAAGRSRVEQHYSLQVQAPRVLGLLAAAGSAR